MSVKRMDIIGAMNTPMRVLYVPAGENSPNHKNKPVDTKDLLEFYDSRYDHTPDGQFISAYFVETLQQGNDYSRGLDLCGGELEWRISSRTLQEVMDWVAYHIYFK